MANTLTGVNLPTYQISSPTGTAGTFLTSNGINGTSWTGATINNTTDNVMIIKQNPASLEVKGRMVVNGRDLEERLQTIEKVLMIPERDVILESSYPMLKKKYDDYIETLSKYRMWETIKGNES